MPSSTAVSQLALTYAASSTPGGTRFSNKSISAASSPFGGFSSCSTREATCFASKGLGAMFSAARSATCASYSVRNVDAAREEAPRRGRSEEGSARARRGHRARRRRRRSARGRGHGRDQGGDPSGCPRDAHLGAGARQQAAHRAAVAKHRGCGGVGARHDGRRETRRSVSGSRREERRGPRGRARLPNYRGRWTKVSIGMLRNIRRSIENRRARGDSVVGRARTSRVFTPKTSLSDGTVGQSPRARPVLPGEERRERAALFLPDSFSGRVGGRFEIFWATLRHVRHFAHCLFRIGPGAGRFWDSRRRRRGSHPRQTDKSRRSSLRRARRAATDARPGPARTEALR